MAQLTVHELAVREYSTEEVIQGVLNIHKLAGMTLSSALKEQNLGYAGEARQEYYQAEQLLKALDEKLNGKKSATVV